jgi:hypothetical protein
MSWDTNIEELGGGKRRYVIGRQGHVLSYADVLRGWMDDGEFRSYFAGVLAEAPYSAYRWETPAVSGSTAGREFEFVLIDAPGLERAPEPRAFDAQLTRSSEPVVAFANLGGDATLIVPRQMGDAAVYPHLAGVVRGAPRAQVDALLKLIGSTVTSRLNASPRWLSTAGMGVAWLHVRIDSRPKYYGHRAYAE